MCVIVYKPKGVAIKKSYLQNCFNNNPDGCGYVFSSSVGLSVRKGYFSFDSFWEDYYKDFESNRKSPFVIHFRIATSGNVDEINCHPFRIDEEVVFAHNGIFYELNGVDKRFSDTVLFREMYLKTLPSGWMYNRSIRALITKIAEDNDSKLVFLNDKGNKWIVGEDSGYWHKGCWYSNRSYSWSNTYGFSTFGYSSEEIDEGVNETGGWNYNDNPSEVEDDRTYKSWKKAYYSEKTETCVYCGVDHYKKDMYMIPQTGYLCERCSDYPEFRNTALIPPDSMMGKTTKLLAEGAEFE
jgi:predicted glutamine amidotransferase